MTATTSSVTSATTPAATPATGDLVNLAVANPASERWPGSVDPTQYTDPGPSYPLEGPVDGQWTGGEFTENAPCPIGGGGVIDRTYETGTDAPQAPFDSAAGPPFAPSRAADPELHAEDNSGAVFANWTVVPAAIGQIIRSTPTGQTYNREYAFDPVTGENVPAENGRVDFDQIQSWDPDPAGGGGYAPWDPGYAERPILNNVAYQATPVTSVGTQYGVAGDIPDRSVYNEYPATYYDAPGDPSVTSGAAAATTTYAGTGSWVLG